MCQSLHRVALQCQQDAEGCWYYHQTVVPCLLAMAVQAAMQGRCGVERQRGAQASPRGSLTRSQRCCRPPPSTAGTAGPAAPCRCGSGGCACPPPCGLQRVPFFQLPAESTQPLLGKALLEEEVLAAMIPVISAATTHLSPE